MGILACTRSSESCIASSGTRLPIMTNVAVQLQRVLSVRWAALKRCVPRLVASSSTPLRQRRLNGLAHEFSHRSPLSVQNTPQDAASSWPLLHLDSLGPIRAFTLRLRSFRKGVSPRGQGFPPRWLPYSLAITASPPELGHLTPRSRLPLAARPALRAAAHVLGIRQQPTFVGP